jgi:hypothetical protein
LGIGDSEGGMGKWERMETEKIRRLEGERVRRIKAGKKSRGHSVEGNIGRTKDE